MKDSTHAPSTIPPYIQTAVQNPDIFAESTRREMEEFFGVRKVADLIPHLKSLFFDREQMVEFLYLFCMRLEEFVVFLAYNYPKVLSTSVRRCLSEIYKQHSGQEANLEELLPATSNYPKKKSKKN